jgi:hypothetical protein
MLQAGLRSFNSTMRALKPSFTLIGSAAEGTRIAIGNELDLTVEFEGFEEPSFQVVDGDPFHLSATGNVPEWIKKYFGKKGKFIYHQFTSDFLDATHSCIENIFGKLPNPINLLRGTTNLEFASDIHRCEKCMNNNRDTKSLRPFEQCEKCAVTVSQTKMGACLQFLWSPEKVYCSVDLVPTFKIKKITALELARIANTAMLTEKPEGWFRYLQKYATSDVILSDLYQDKVSTFSSVLLKNLNWQSDHNYFARPGQHLGVEKFKGDAWRMVYIFIKAWISYK